MSILYRIHLVTIERLTSQATRILPNGGSPVARLATQFPFHLSSAAIMNSPTQDLIQLRNLPPNVHSTISGFMTTHAPPALIKAIRSTLELLAPVGPDLSYASSHFTLISPNAASKKDAAFRVQSYLDELTRAAYEVSSSLFCSSILAGRSSESDEYGDVGIWVGTMQNREPLDVLRNLGLDQWISDKGGKVSAFSVQKRFI